jgi:hypothetical protein
MSERTPLMRTQCWVLGDGHRGRRVFGTLPIFLLIVALVGCGNVPAEDPGGQRVDSPRSSLSSDRSSEETRAATDPDPRTFGIDTIQWPGDQAGAQANFDRMPDRLAGLQAKRGGWSGPSTGVVYGPGDSGVAAWVMGPEIEVGDPKSNLAVMFGMGMFCLKNTYAGTATQSRWGGPDIDRKGEFGPDDGLWWFSCNYSGEDPGDTGYAIGWVSGDLAWLVTAPDKATTRLAISELIKAAK